MQCGFRAVANPEVEDSGFDGPGLCLRTPEGQVGAVQRDLDSSLLVGLEGDSLEALKLTYRTG
jgi:hypothetical protein